MKLNSSTGVLLTLLMFRNYVCQLQYTVLPDVYIVYPPIRTIQKLLVYFFLRFNRNSKVNCDNKFSITFSHRNYRVLSSHSVNNDAPNMSNALTLPTFLRIVTLQSSLPAYFLLTDFQAPLMAGFENICIVATTTICYITITVC